MSLTLLVAFAAQASSFVDGGAITLSLEAYGERIEGVVAYDAGALAALGVRVGAGEGIVIAEYGLRIGDAYGGVFVIQEHTDAFLALDLDGNGTLDLDDPTFATIRLFVDENVDGIPQPGELRTLESLGIQHISRWGEVRFRERVIAGR